MDNSTAELKMIFQSQVQSHDLEGCWMDGYFASQRGGDEMDNPFEDSTKEYEYWIDGWWSGLYGEPMLFPDFKPSKNETTSESAFSAKLLQWIKKRPYTSRRNLAIAGGVSVGVIVVLGTLLLDAA